MSILLVEQYLDFAASWRISFDHGPRRGRGERPIGELTDAVVRSISPCEPESPAQ
jgi:hypothetical protein